MSAPTNDDLTALSDLRDSDDRADIELWNAAAEAPLATADRSQPMPVSHAQLGIWFFETYTGEGAVAYHIPTVIRLRGPLDVDRLRSAIAAVVRRHEILRCGLVERGGEVLLRPFAPAPVALQPELLAETEVAGRVAALAAVPFDLAQGPLVRWHLFETGTDDHRLLVLQHHIISDGWSVGLLVRELLETYESGEQRVPPALQYADYAAFSRASLNPAAIQPSLEHWVPQLRDAPLLELPRDRPRPPRPSYRGRHHHVRLDAALTAEVRRFARARRTTPYAVLFSAHALLLARYSGQNDFVVTMPVDGRTRPEFAPMLGCFVNLLPIRCRIDGSVGFAATVDRMFDALLEAASFQDAPFHRIVAALGAGEATHEAALAKAFRSLFVMDSSNRDLRFAGAGLTAEIVVEADHDVAKTDLSFALQEDGDEIALRIEYATDLFEADTVARLAGHFHRLLNCGIAEPDRPVSGLAMLSPQEFELLVIDGNRTATDYPRDVSLADLFATTARRFPDRPAFVDGERTVDYRTLDARAESFRAVLCNAGLEPGDRVAVLLERGLEALIAILATIKAGAAYVPIDPHYPEERIGLILADAAVRIIVAPAAWAASTAGSAAFAHVVVDESVAEGTAPRPAPPRRATDAAYVCYTSGTSGRPRGVVIPDRAVARLVLGTDYVELGPERRIAFASNIVFDAATLEIWGALLHGGCLVLVPRETLLEVDALSTLLRRQRVDMLWLTAPLFHRLAEERPSLFDGVRTLLTGGAVVNPAAVARVQTSLGARAPQILNGYGPTETTTFAAVHRVTPADLSDLTRSLPIGRAIANTRVYVTDAQGEPVPVGVPGQLLIAGDGVALGYLNQPELTAQKFSDLVWEHPELSGDRIVDRVYRTGDLVRWRPDGALEFLGRTDRQIKLRGFRVELDEIEAAILAHPEIAQAVVVVRGDTAEPTLDAYFAGDHAPSAEALHGFLGERLPAYMLPHRCLRVIAMPVNVSGKIDVEALPAIPATAGPAAAGRDGASSPIEHALAAILAEVLVCPVPGLDDDFFALGGDSIQSIRVAGRARDSGFALTVRDIFDQRTIARMAAVLEQRAAPPQAAPDGGPETIPLLPIQRWFFELDLAAPGHFNQAILLRAGTKIDRARLQRALASLVAAHEALRSRWRQSAHGSVDGQIILPAEACEPVAVSVHHLARDGDPAAEIAAVCTAWQATFDIAAGPIMAAGVFEGHPDGSDRLFLAVHHLAVDLISWWIIVDQLHRLYDGDAPAAVEAGTLGRWSRALAAKANAAATARELAHWQDAVGGPRHFTITAMPDAAPRLERERRVSAHDFDRAVATGERLLGLRPNEIVIAAAELALAGAARERDVTVGIEGHGREPSVLSADLSRTVGWFTSLHPCRMRLPASYDADDDLIDALAVIKDALRSAPENGIGFGLLRHLATDRAMAATLAGWSGADLAVNYLGSLDLAAGDWQIQDGLPGATVSPSNLQPHALDLAAFRSGDALVLALVADGTRIAAEVAEAFCDRLEALLVRIATVGASRRDRLVTAADHPLSGLGRDDLVRLLGPAGGQGRRVLRLTPVEEGMLFESLRHPESNAYTIQAHWRQRDGLDPDQLRAAFAALVARHDALRSRIVATGLPHPVRIVEPAATVDWTLLDWRDLNQGAQGARWAGLLAEERRRGFDLGAPSGARVTAIRIGDDVWQVLWTFHHIAFDGWSVSILLSDLAQAYDDLGHGTALAGERPPSFDGFLAAQARTPAADCQAFWSAQLADLTAPTDLAFRRPASQLGVAGPDGASMRLNVPIAASIAADLKAFCAQAAVTPSAVCQFAFALALARCAGGNEVTYGTTASGRTLPIPDIDRMVGLAISTVPVRIAFDPSMRAIDGIRALHSLTVSSQEQAHISLPEIQRLSGIAAGERLFHSLFVYENYPSGGFHSDHHLQFSEMQILDKTDAALTMLVVPGEAPHFEVAFDPTLFANDAIERLCGHVAALLQGIVSDPAQQIAALDMTTPAERHDLLVKFNDTLRPVDLGHTVLDLIAESVTRHPDRVAVSHSGASLTYRQLDQASADLARRIRQRHRAVVGAALAPETIVALVLERGLAMLVSILGVMRAGGAYLPIDTEDPQERIAFTIEDGRAALVITADVRTSERCGLQPALGDRLIVVDEAAAELAAEDLPEIAADQLAYVIYTSGSSGRPKGTLVEHRGLVNRLAWVQGEYCALAPEDRVLQKTPYTFDVSVWELFWPLVHGARLVVADPGGHRDPSYLQRTIKDEAITVVHFVPSMLQIFVEHPELETLRSLRLVATSGEALPTRLAARVIRALPQVMMLNLYGPTETTIEVSGHVCTLEDEQQGALTPIGRPAWNTTLHVLDPAGRLSPVGVPGDLHIGGVQVARGYLDRPELTAERFIPDPFGPGRLYRSGDLCRRRPDGSIEYQGRIDFQMKIRGMRVEPGEVEAVLEGCSGIGRACVIGSERDGYAVLLAYVTCAATLQEDDVKRQLAALLPAHMVPARIVQVAEFPLTTSGKVDRKRLVALDTGAAAPDLPGTSVDPPASATEAIVAAVYREVLKAGGAVPTDRSFFALGGHSLTAMRAAMRLSERLGTDVPVRLVFEHSSVRALAAALDRCEARVSDDTPPLVPVDRQGFLQPAFAQARILFLEAFAASPALYNIPAAMRIAGEIDEDALIRAAASLLDAHEILRTRYTLAAGQPQVLVDAVAELDFAVVEVAPAALDEHLRDEANRGFDLASGPPIRFRLLRLGANDHVLVVTLHHVVTDGWSLEILLGDLAERYEAEVLGLPSFPEPDEVSYIDYAAWQRATMTDERVAELSRYWQRRLDGAPALEFPTDRPRPAIATYRGDTTTFALDRQETEALRGICAERGITLFPLLLAAWSLVLARYSGQADLVVGTPVSHRPLHETERMTGLFQNTVPLRVQLRDDETVAGLVERLSGTTAEDLAHQQLPFELMIEALGAARDPSRAPLYQAMLILDGGDPTRSAFAPPGLAVTPIPLGSDTAKVDLSAAFALSEDGLAGTIEYATDLFGADSMARLARHLQAALRSFAADPSQLVGEVDFLGVAERSDLLIRFNATDRPVDPATTVLDLIAARVAARPEAPAVRHAGEQLSYRELDQAATRLARTIRDRFAEAAGHDMPAETVVALLLERGIPMIVSILGVLKAGGAWLPLDPDDPAERIAFMLEDAQAAYVIVDALTVRRPAAEACPAARTLVFQSVIAQAESATALPDIVADQLAYLIYTSGSTGRPKGVLVEHRGLANRIAWVQHDFPLDPRDRILQRTPYTFDVAISELLWPLAAGAGLVFAEPGRHGDPAYLHRVIQDERISVLHFVPSVFQAFTEHPGLDALTTVRLVVLIGEPLPSRLAAYALRTLPAAMLVNFYGPTEATIDVSAHVCSVDDEERGPVVPIGRPGWNTTLHVLDQSCRLAPIGVPGELAIGGVQLARGYLDRPEITADRFIVNPFGHGRLYRTSDLVRRLPDGEIEFLGRMDFQVKIRGMRVELGEVETRLEACLGVIRACAIVSRLGGEEQLIAYVTGAPELSERDLKAELATALPRHMVPARIVRLEAFPLTTSGKVDRRRLPEPVATPRQAAAAAGPLSPTEAALVAIWRELLGHESFSCLDGFFDVGGSSLGAMRMVSAISEQLQRQLPVVDIFRFPTIRDLARHLDGGGSDAARGGRLDEARARAETRRAMRRAGRA